MKNPQFGSHNQVYVEYLIFDLLQTFKINPWTIWLLNLTVQVSSSLQFASNWHAEKTLNSLCNCKFWIFDSCIHSTSPPASKCICGEFLSHQYRLIPWSVIIRPTLTADLHDLLHVTDHTCLHDHFWWNMYQNPLHMWLVIQTSKSWENLA